MVLDVGRVARRPRPSFSTVGRPGDRSGLHAAAYEITHDPDDDRDQDDGDPIPKERYLGQVSSRRDSLVVYFCWTTTTSSVPKPGRTRPTNDPHLRNPLSRVDPDNCRPHPSQVGQPELVSGTLVVGTRPEEAAAWNRFQSSRSGKLLVDEGIRDGTGSGTRVTGRSTARGTDRPEGCREVSSCPEVYSVPVGQRRQQCALHPPS